MYKTTVPIKGMHCRSCELLIEENLKEIKGVKKIEVNHQKACAILHHESSSLSNARIIAAVEKAGYEIGMTDKKPWISFEKRVILDFAFSIILLAAIILMAKIMGLNSLLSINPGKPSNLTVVLLVGLTAGFSTCMALVGGLVLGISAQFAAAHPQSTVIKRFRPHLAFNLGRIISYTVLGGLIGFVGSALQISSVLLGVLTIGVAGVMMLLGLQLTGLFPRMDDFKVALPIKIAKFLGISTKMSDSYSDKQALIMGAATFFLPCGFTQAMQLYAVSTGSFTAGAMTMAAFAIGTAPGLLGVGGLTSILKGEVAQKFFRFSGVVVMLLAIFNLNNGINLLGWNHLVLNERISKSKVQAMRIERDAESQVIRMNQLSSGYFPNKFVVIKGVPVKWIVVSKSSYSCASSLLAQKIGIRANLNEGENVFEFTPNQVGTIPFSCSMGMYGGVIEVVEKE